MGTLNQIKRGCLIYFFILILVYPVLASAEIVLMGGDHGGIGHYHNDTWNSTDYGATWTQVNASSGWVQRDIYNSVSQGLNGTILIMGGSNGFYRNDTWGSDDGGKTWTQINATPAWSEREGAGIVVLQNNYVILMGGATNAGFNFNNDTWRSTDGGNVWTLLNPSSGWTERELPCVVRTYDGSIVLMGGLNWFLGTPALNDTWRSTDGGLTWNLKSASAEWVGRWGQTCVAMPNGDIILMGGFDNVHYLNDTWISDDFGATWTLMNASSGWNRRYFHSTVTESLFPPFPLFTENIIYGQVFDDTTGLPVNGATVNIHNSSWSDTNTTFTYGAVPGVYWFEDLAASVDYHLNATKATYP